MAPPPYKTKSDRDENEVLQHSISIAPDFTFPPQEFYDLVEKALTERNVPGLEISRVKYPQGGPLSHKRLYLRLIRERLAFEACAAPFGVDYFFSCRTIYSPAVIKLWHILVILFVFASVYELLGRYLGPRLALYALVGLIIAVAQVFRNTVAMELSDLDTMLLKTPALGPIYERLFRKDTYYRKDTRLVYLEIVPKLIQTLIDEITAAKGAKLVRQYDRGPIFGELYKRATRDQDEIPA